MTNVITVNIEAFSTHFSDSYSFCYDHYDRVAGFAEAVAAFDDFCEHHLDFVREFCAYRGDCITSDREAAAFMFALDGMGVLQ